MRALGLDPKNPEDRARFSLITYKDFVEDMSAFVRAVNPSFNIFLQ